MKKNDYLKNATSKIYDSKAKALVEAELKSHIDDREDALLNLGFDSDAAEEKAVDAMGDSELVCDALGELHNDFYNPAFDIAYTVILAGIMGGLYYLINRFVVGDPGLTNAIFSALFLPFSLVVLYVAICAKKKKEIPLVFSLLQISGFGYYSYTLFDWLNQQFSCSFDKMIAYITKMQLFSAYQYANKKQAILWAVIFCAFLLLGVLLSIVYQIKIRLCATKKIDNTIRRWVVNFYRYFSFVFLAVAIFFGVKCYMDYNNAYNEYIRAYNTAIEISETCENVAQMQAYIEKSDLPFEVVKDGEDNVIGYNYTCFYTNLNIRIDTSDPETDFEEYKAEFESTYADILSGEYGSTLMEYADEIDADAYLEEYHNELLMNKVEYSIKLGVDTVPFKDNYNSITLNHLAMNEDSKEKLFSFIPYEHSYNEIYDCYKSLVPISLSFTVDNKLALSRCYSFDYLVYEGAFCYQESRTAYNVGDSLNDFYEYKNTVMDAIKSNPNASDEELAALTNTTIEKPDISKDEYTQSVNMLGSYFDDYKESMISVYDMQVKYIINEEWADGNWYFVVVGSPLNAVVFYCSDGEIATEYLNENGRVMNSITDRYTKVSFGGYYFDKYGYCYSQPERVPYYTQDGKKLFFYEKVTTSEDTSVRDIKTYCFSDRESIYYESNRCYVDENGYFYYDTNGNIKMDDNLDYRDSKGNLYTRASETSWNNDGDIVDIDVKENYTYIE